MGKRGGGINPHMVNPLQCLSDIILHSLAVNLTNALKILNKNLRKVAKNYLEHFAKSVMWGGLIFNLI